MEILTNQDYTLEFRRRCVFRSPGVILQPSNLFTHKFTVMIEGMTLVTVAHVDSAFRLIFLN